MAKKKENVIISYKGFNDDMTCRGFKYEVGKSYEEKTAKCCSSGFHACPMPLSVFNYYVPAESRYALVEQNGEFDIESDKIASTKIKIKTELNLFELVKAQIEWVHNQLDPKKKNNSKADRGAATQTGDRGAAIVTGKNSVAMAMGIHGKAKADKNGCIVVCDWQQDSNFNWHIENIYSAKVGGKIKNTKIKPNTL